MITQDKITDIFCTLDEFSKKFDAEVAKGELISSTGIRRRHREASLSDGEIMTILIVHPDSVPFRDICQLQALLPPQILYCQDCSP